MTAAPFDCVVRGGTVVTATGSHRADIGIVGEKIHTIGVDLAPGTREIDATKKLVLPGGIDPHAHIQQVSASGRLNADTWESATAAAARGGTTTVIAFAAQHIGLNLTDVVNEYSALARSGALIDYSFHLLIGDPTPATLSEDVPALIEAGYSSLKIFMTYDKLRLTDEQVLDVLVAARASRSLVCVHAENHGVIKWMTARLVDGGHHAMKFHALSHPRTAEVDGIARMVRLSALTDQPIMIFHVSTAEGAAVIRQARGEGLKVYGETCPQYLFMTEDDLDRPGPEAVRWVCSPPMRTSADQAALWRALDLNDLQTVSSDHAPYALDATGKFQAGSTPRFDQVPSGIPGIELRLPLLFDAMVSKGGLGVEKFVELTSTAPARLYGLHPRKGAIAPGADADIVVWDTTRETVITDAATHDRTGYTPYAGRTVRGWPSTVLVRGHLLVEDGTVKRPAGSGVFLPRTGGISAEPAGIGNPETPTMTKLGVMDLLSSVRPTSTGANA